MFDSTDVDRVKHFVESGVNVRSKDGRHHTPLHKAASKGHVNIARFLVTKGAALNARSKKGESPLHRAIKTHNLPMVRYLVNAGAPLTVADRYGFTPLHLAVYEKDEPIVSFLLAKGANVNARIPGSGMTPLHIAAKYGNVGYISVQSRNRQGTRNIQQSKSMMRLLLRHGAKVVKDSRGITPEAYFTKSVFGGSVVSIQQDFNRGQMSARGLYEGIINPSKRR